MKLYNTLSRKIEEFIPTAEGKVGVYACGPTVYDFVQIGNWRTYILSDLLVRTLKYLGYDVDYVMNITDVGHLTGDNEGDADTGEDRLEKGARREGKTAQEIAKFYAEDFKKSFKSLNMLSPNMETKSGDGFTWATDYIDEQIKMVEKIEKKGFAYPISDGIYFDTQAYEAAGNTYGELSNLDQIKAGARVAENPEKKDPRDFALWKFSPKGEKRHMEWESPWETGFPGWHIECSAMSCDLLGNRIDIHVGGEDLRSTHHPNEIAQAEAATGKKPFVKYWVHGAFLKVDGGRMGKSLGNAYTLHDLEKRGFSPLDLRYFFLIGHYRKPLNFTWEALEAAKKGREKLMSQIASLKEEIGDKKILSFRELMSDNDTSGVSYGLQFGYNSEYELGYGNSDEEDRVVEEDLGISRGLAIVWDLLADKKVPALRKLSWILNFDQVLGLGLEEEAKKEKEKLVVPEEITKLLIKRKEARVNKDWQKSDELRTQVEKLGFKIEDGGEEQKVSKS
ncbi:MAG: cysteine--tRNA ligase [Patescibacteria group bacterium]